MLRPLPRLPDLEPEPDDDSGSFGGLADVLEPDPFGEQDATTSVSMRFPTPSCREPALLPPPSSIHAPVQIQDFAFADTIVASDEVEAPPSGPIFFDDATRSGKQCVTPLAFPLPPAAEAVGFSTRLRVLCAHVRHAFLRSREEMRELWGGTAAIVGDEANGEGGAATSNGFVIFMRRILALWSCFQWSRTDLTRAAMIGLAVFVVAGVVGATTMDFSASDGGGGTEVRAGRTLDQHTARKIVIRFKR
jgi:hypothetical protein